MRAYEATVKREAKKYESTCSKSNVIILVIILGFNSIHGIR